MGGLFSSPKLPPPPPPPEEPEIEDAKKKGETEAERRRKAARARGTVLTSPLGVTNQGQQATGTTLLGG